MDREKLQHFKDTISKGFKPCLSGDELENIIDLALKGLDEWEPIENGKTGHLVLAAAPDGWDGAPYYSVGFHALVYWCEDENDWCDDITDKPYGHAKHLTHFINLDKIPTPKDMGGAK